jgi:3-dehydroquinate dehydratase/shikimate dehydrogenase
MSRSLLCETVTGGTMAELLAARDAATDADLVELRLDGVSDVDVVQALHGRSRPAIVTCRPAWEGGRFDGGEDARLRILSEALQSGAEHVDVEWRALKGAGGSGAFDGLMNPGERRVLVSSHDFSGIPDDLPGQVRAMRATGAALIKIAVTPGRLSETLPLRHVASRGDAVVIGMGDAGMPTRLLATRFQSRWTYGGRGVAPGQVPTVRMLRDFRFKGVGEETMLYGVVGSHVSHSVLPVLHNAAFAAAGLDAVCVPLSAADFEDFLTFAEALSIAGASVCVPFGRDALAVSARADDAAASAGTANVLRRIPEGWEATNTSRAGDDVGRSMAASKASYDDLVAEAELQWEWWTGRRPQPGVMSAAARREGAEHTL